MKNNPQMLKAAIEGYNGTENTYIWSSATWYAYQAGEEMARRKLAPPLNCVMGRGHSVRIYNAAGLEFVAKFPGSSYNCDMTLEKAQ